MPLLPPPTTEEFTRALGHEMRNLMGCVAVSTEVLRIGAGGEAVRQSALAILDRQTGRLESVLDAALDVARMLDQRDMQCSGAIDLNEMLLSLLAAPLADARALMLADEPVWAIGEPVRLAGALQFLLNTVLAASPQAPVVVCLGVWGDHAVLRAGPVQAEGPVSLSPDVPPAFERPLGTPGEIMPGGLGLEGLTARRILALHGASLQWLTLPSSRGFELRLPVAAAPRQAATLIA